jgi:ferredoxin
MCGVHVGVASPDGQLDLVIEAAEECPGECIFVDVE